MIRYVLHLQSGEKVRCYSEEYTDQVGMFSWGSASSVLHKAKKEGYFKVRESNTPGWFEVCGQNSCDPGPINFTMNSIVRIEVFKEWEWEQLLKKQGKEGQQ